MGPNGLAWRIDSLADGRFGVTGGDVDSPDCVVDSLDAARAVVDTFEARHDDPAPAVLEMSWADAGKQGERFIGEAEARVVDWFWGPALVGWERFEPYWSQQGGERPSTRRRRAQPTDKSSWDQFGADVNGEIVVHRRWGSPVQPAQVESARAADGNALLVFETSGRSQATERRLGQLHVATRADDGRIERVDSWYRDGLIDGFRWLGTLFEYESDQLVCSRESRRMAPDIGWERRPGGKHRVRLELEHFAPLRYEHDGEGLLKITAGQRLVYRRRAVKEIAAAQRLVRAELPERIVAWVTRNAPAEPVYCLAIGYVDFYNSPLPPTLGLGTVAELRRWRETEPGDLKPLAFNPFEFACHEDLDAPDLAGAYQTLNQDWLSGHDDTSTRRLFNAIAKTLAARDWSRLQTSPAGLAVVAVNVELGDYDRDVKATVPARQWRALLKL